jgi:hypothetical protein
MGSSDSYLRLFKYNLDTNTLSIVDGDYKFLETNNDQYHLMIS